MNKVILLGRLTKTPELTYSQSADPVAICRTGLAVRRPRAREGDPDVDFFNITAFRKNAEHLSKYFTKGQLVVIVGRLQNQSWETTTGEKKSTTVIIVEETHFAESKKDTQAAAGAAPSQTRDNPMSIAERQALEAGFPPGFIPSTMEEDDDLPF